ncbi:hypothetical protein GCM10011500_48030 [Mucilaginibacter rubeus]|nr:hypothetical protein GCM10011500_48030 [Mucilaginibacter rubeus]
MSNQISKPRNPEGLANIQCVTNVHGGIKITRLYLKKEVTMRAVKIYFIGETVRATLKHIAAPAARTFTFKHSP